MAGPKRDHVAASTVGFALLNELSSLAAYLASVDAAGTGDLTLTAAQYQCSVLRLTGVLTGVRGIVVPLDAGRVWTVVNDTTGAFALTVKGVSGTGIVIGTGKTAQVWTDGTNVLRITPDSP